MVVEVIAGQVGHHRHVKGQCSDSPLVQAVGRHFHGNRLGAGLFQVGQGRLHGNRVWRGVQAALQRAIETGAQGADDAAVLTQQVQRLGNQLGHAGLAVGARHAHQVELAARVAVETPGDVGQLRSQALDRNQRHIGDRQHGGAFHFIGDRSRTALQGIGDMRTAIELAARYRQEQVTGAYITAIQRQLTNKQIVAGMGKNLVQAKRHQPRPPLALTAAAGGPALACCVGGRLSGVIFIKRRVPDITLLNTGAETRPPK